MKIAIILTGLFLALALQIDTSATGDHTGNIHANAQIVSN